MKQLEGKVFRPKADRIMRSVCEVYDLKMADLRGPCRNRRIARPRQVCMYLMHEGAGLSLAQTGRILGRNHTTVRHGVRQITGLMERDIGLRFEVAMIGAAQMLRADPKE